MIKSEQLTDQGSHILSWWPALNKSPEIEHFISVKLTSTLLLSLFGICHLDFLFGEYYFLDQPKRRLEQKLHYTVYMQNS